MKRKLKRRIQSFMICLALVFSLLPVNTMQVSAGLRDDEIGVEISAGILFEDVNIVDTTIGEGESATFSVGNLKADITITGYKWNVVKGSMDYTTDLLDESMINNLFSGINSPTLTVKAFGGNCVLDGAVISLTVEANGESQEFTGSTATLSVSHTAGEWIVDKEATEEETGSRHKECIYCGTTVETEEIEKLDCTHTIPRLDWEPGEKYHNRLCLCGRSCLVAEAHTAGDWILDKEATPEEAGKRHKECTVCGYTMEEETISYEASVINAISVSNVDVPQKGEAIGDVENTPTSMTYGGQYQLSSIGFEVYNEETEAWDGLSEEDIIAENTSYRMKIWLAAATGYTFSTDISNANISVNEAAGTLAEITDDKQFAAVYQEFRYDCEHSFKEKIKDEYHYVEGTGNNCKSAHQYYYDCEYCDVISSEDIWTSDIYGRHNLDENNYCDICEATIYDVWVGNTQINSSNAEDVFGDGTVSYNPETNVLKLNGYDNGGKAYEYEEYCYAAIYSEGDLKLEVSGTNDIINTEGTEDDDLGGIMSFGGGVTISGDGELNVDSTHQVIVAGNGDVIILGGTLQLVGDAGIFGKKVQIKGGNTTITTSEMCTFVYGEGNTLEVTGGNLCLRPYVLGAFVYNPVKREYIALDLSGYKGYIARALIPDISLSRMRRERWEEYNPENLKKYCEINLEKIPEEKVITSVEIANFKIPKVGETLDDIENTPDTLTCKGNYKMVGLGWYTTNEEGEEESLEYDEPLQEGKKYSISLTVYTDCEWGFPTDLKAEDVTINGTKLEEIYKSYDEDGGGYLTMYMYFKPETHTHSKTEIEAKSSTCKTQGWDAYKKCECGQLFDADDNEIATIPYRSLAAHTYDAGVETKAPTETETGIKTYTCSVCGATKTEVIPVVSKQTEGATPAPKGTIISDKSGTKYKVTKSAAKNGTVTYVKPKSNISGSVTIPSTVTINGITYKITAIEANAFKNNKKITKVTIGKNIVSIGKNAFMGCSKLKTLKLGASLTTIDDKAFYKCTALTKVTIPAKVTKIGKSAFYGCKTLTSVTIGKNVKTIGTSAFYGCKKLKKITINTTKLTSKKVGSKAFSGTPKNAVVKVPKKSLKAYKKFLVTKGINKKATIK